MRDTFAVGFDVEFNFFVLLDDMLFDVLDVDAGVFDGNGFFASGDLDSQAIRPRQLRLWLGRRRGRILSGNGKRSGKHESKEKST